MNFKILRNEKDFLDSKQTWEQFYKFCNNCTVFQTFEWNFEWWSKAHKEDYLFIIIFFKKSIENPVAIFPLIIDKEKRLRFIADIHTDYSKILTADLNLSDIHDISNTFFNIVNNCENKTIELKNINQNDTLINYLQLPFDNKKIFYQSNGCSHLEVTPVKDNFFGSFTHLKSKKRSELKRVYKKYSDFTSSILTKETHTFPLDKIKSISTEMTESGLREETFLNDDLINIISVLFEKGYLIIHAIENESGETIAMNFVLISSKNSYLLWIDIYKDLQYINIFSYIAFMKRMTETVNEKITFDFGRGLYDYKIKNFLPEIEQQYTFFFSKQTIDFVVYLLKLVSKKSIMNFYKKNKTLIKKFIER